jgi:hypothetical protein
MNTFYIFLQQTDWCAQEIEQMKGQFTSMLGENKQKMALKNSCHQSELLLSNS